MPFLYNLDSVQVLPYIYFIDSNSITIFFLIYMYHFYAAVPSETSKDMTFQFSSHSDM